MLRPEIEERLIGLAHQNYQGARLAAGARGQARGGQAPRLQPRRRTDRRPIPPALAELASWAEQSLGLEISTDELQSMSAAEVRRTLLNALDAQERPEMREMEKAVLLQILDSSWMEHLRAMDHLRSSIGLQGYAQIDPKVEYKREGMRIFAEMWNGIGDRVTDLIFRVEQFDPEFLNYLGSQWKLDRAQTIHQQAESQLAPSAAAGRRPPTAGCRHRRQPAAPPKKNANPSATLQKRSVATTLAPADPVKNSKPATCANNPRATHFDRSLQFTQLYHSSTSTRLSSQR